ncbi:hypothetical protein OV079_53265 [Nannocystis pusilla]|uniref:Uncharacterized protein n=1 Tax=Nannocystis pusilla TaxID=889268 RepID=A0A9X3F1J8_9BACT|nr:hypothetical protein [Nannocystis pusilla]MCY1014146.1 hypothetical protein [Nannocystis pusilla]
MNSRSLALTVAKRLIPGSPLGLWLFAQSARLFDRVPTSGCGRWPGSAAARCKCTTPSC